jgi:hypothetical protein
MALSLPRSSARSRGALVPLREFTDERGVEWRVWDVRPDRARPWTESEFLPEYRDGWLAFESSAGQKRRLPMPFPADWHELPLPELEALRARASVSTTPPRAHPAITPESLERPAPAQAPTQPSAEEPAAVGREHRSAAAEEDERALREALRQGRRTFTSPRGREWTVRLHERIGVDGDPETVLRFTTADIVLDLKPWPDDWAELPTRELSMLVLDADPPPAPSAPRGRRRRREDRGK